MPKCILLTHDLLTHNLPMTICQLTICQNRMIRQIAQKSHDLPTRNDAGTTPGLSAGRVARCSLPLANIRSSFTVLLLVIARRENDVSIVKTTFWQIVSRQIVIQHFFYCIKNWKFAEKQRFFWQIVIQCFFLLYKKEQICLKTLFGIFFGRNIFGKLHGKKKQLI